MMNQFACRAFLWHCCRFFVTEVSPHIHKIREKLVTGVWLWYVSVYRMSIGTELIDQLVVVSSVERIDWMVNGIGSRQQLSMENRSHWNFPRRNVVSIPSIDNRKWIAPISTYPLKCTPFSTFHRPHHACSGQTLGFAWKMSPPNINELTVKYQSISIHCGTSSR